MPEKMNKGDQSYHCVAAKDEEGRSLKTPKDGGRYLARIGENAEKAPPIFGVARKAARQIWVLNPTFKGNSIVVQVKRITRVGKSNNKDKEFAYRVVRTRSKTVGQFGSIYEYSVKAY